MDLETFLYNLHFDVDKASPPNWEVDWKDAPLSYKLYHGLPSFSLSTEVPLTLEGEEVPMIPTLRRIGDFLWYTCGLTQISQSTFTDGQNRTQMQSYRRFIPSGGALYPNELYVYLKMEDLPVGVYHYDVAHHRLVLLREGNFDSYIAKSLGNRCEVSTCFGIVFVSTMFWKNFFKYNNFSYRLQGLDAGVLMGQLLEVAKRFSFDSGVYFQFLDRAVNHLLGLSEQEESVYAVIPLSVETTNWFASEGSLEDVSAAELYRELPEVHHEHYVRSQKVIEYPMLIKMNEASMLESTKSFRTIEREESGNCEGEVKLFPQVQRLSYDLATVCGERYSPDLDFTLGRISQTQLAILLQEATASFSYRNDLDGEHKREEHRISLYGCLYQIEGIPNGAYCYDSKVHGVRLIQPGDYRLQLQYGMTLGNVNLLQVPICMHVVGDKYHFKEELGYRGYRIQQMESGMLIQRLLIAAVALGFGGHPLLGFDTNLSDKIYKLDSKGKTNLVQLPIGPYRKRPWLRGSLHG